MQELSTFNVLLTMSHRDIIKMSYVVIYACNKMFPTPTLQYCQMYKILSQYDK